jgi:hypothetical protein
MLRRHLLGALSAPVFHRSNKKTFEAIAAPQMPACLESDCDAGILEVRRYSGAAQAGVKLVLLLESHGIRVVQRQGLQLQLAFTSIEERQALWQRVTSDVDWKRLRDQANLTTVEISVYG